jgi:hypothetical protein
VNRNSHQAGGMCDAHNLCHIIRYGINTSEQAECKIVIFVSPHLAAFRNPCVITMCARTRND